MIQSSSISLSQDSEQSTFNISATQQLQGNNQHQQHVFQNQQNQIVFNESFDQSQKINISQEETNSNSSFILNTFKQDQQQKIWTIQEINTIKQQIILTKLITKKIKLQFRYIKDYWQPKINYSVYQNNQSKSLYVQIQTKKLLLRSVKESDVDNIYNHLYSQQEVMRLFAIGLVKEYDKVVSLVQKHTKRWKQNDPYSGLVIENKLTKQFIGYIVLGYGDEICTSQMALLIRKDKWNQKYGEQAGGAIVLFYSEYLKQNNYLIRNNQFKKIVLMCHNQNFKSHKLFKKLPTIEKPKQIRYNAERYIFQYYPGFQINNM